MVRSWESLEEEYRAATPRSRALWEQGRSLMPAGVIKGEHWIPPYPFYVDRARDCYLWDLDGRRYVDFANHHTAMVLGHTPPMVKEAVRRELDRGIGLSAPTALEFEMAKEITGRVPSVEKVRFANSGSEATQHAARLIRAVTGKPKVAKFEGAFQGSNDALDFSLTPPLDLAGPEDAPVPVPNNAGLPPGSADNVVMLPYGRRESLELILREQRDELAGVFYDAKPGMFNIPKDFHRFVGELTRELGLIMVMDEVISFGVGYGGYQGAYGIDPDLTVFGKIVGGGFPVGALGGRADLMDTLDNSQSTNRITMSGTFSGNNFTLAAGLANLRSLTPDVYEKIESMRARLHGGLAGAFAGAGVPLQLASEGSVLSLYITQRPVTDYRGAASSDVALAERIRLGLLLKGYYLRVGLVRTTISTPMGDEHIDGLVAAVKEVLAEED